MSDLMADVKDMFVRRRRRRDGPEPQPQAVYDPPPPYTPRAAQGFEQDRLGLAPPRPRSLPLTAAPSPMTADPYAQLRRGPSGSGNASDNPADADADAVAHAMTSTTNTNTGTRVPVPGSASPPPPRRHAPASLSTLPPPLLTRILALTLDTRALPPAADFADDPELDSATRALALFYLRGTSRLFFHVITALFRHRFVGEYTSLRLRFSSAGASSSALVGHEGVAASSPLPRSDPSRDPRGYVPVPPILVPTLPAQREAAVLDRFVVLRLGGQLRLAESSLYGDEDGEDVRTLFVRHQPAARVEDLLARLPPHLVAHARSPADAPGSGLGGSSHRLPLPYPAVSVGMTQLWAQLRCRGALVVEVRRAHSPEETAARLAQALNLVHCNELGWGARWDRQSESWPYPVDSYGGQ